MNFSLDRNIKIAVYLLIFSLFEIVLSALLFRLDFTYEYISNNILKILYWSSFIFIYLAIFSLLLIIYKLLKGYLNFRKIKKEEH